MVRARFPGNADMTKRKPTTDLASLNPPGRAIGLAGPITAQLAQATDCLKENKIEEPKVDRECNG
jgi:hypothetical protein